MPEYIYAKGRIPETVQFIAKEMKEYDDEYAKMTWEEYQRDSKMQKIVDRTVENILNALVEVCGTILAEEGKTAENYAKVLKMAAEMLGFKRDEARELSKLALHRNRLVHRYLNMKWQAIKAYKEEACLIKRVMDAIIDRESRKDR